MMYMRMHKGFTLPEILLTIALLGAIAGMSMPLQQRFQEKNDLDIAAVSSVQAIRRAQLLAQAVDGDTSWGVSVQTGSITLFQGTSYSGRDAAFDEVTDVPATIVPSGTMEYVFTALDGDLGSNGTLTLTAPHDSRTITTNTKGMVSY